MCSYLKYIESNGVSLSKIGTTGYGLNRKTALAAIELLKKEGIPILGGDVLKQTNNEIGFTYDSWYIDKEPDIDEKEYVKRSVEKTIDYIKNYPEQEDEIIIYNLVTGEKID